MDELKEQYMTTQFIVVRYGDEQFGYRYQICG